MHVEVFLQAYTGGSQCIFVPTSMQAASIMSNTLEYLAEGFHMQHSHLQFASLVPVLYIVTELSLTCCQLYYYIS